MPEISDEEAREVLLTTSGWVPVDPLAEGGGARVYRVMPMSLVQRFQSLSTPIDNARAHTQKRGIELAAAISEIASGTTTVFAAGKVSKERTHRMHREIEILRDVQHPNLIRMITFDQTPEPVWYVMELLQGGTVKDAATRFKGQVALVLKGMEQVANALSALHTHDKEKPIVHRDVKPANIFLRENGDWILGDPGVAYRDDGKDATTTRPVSKDWFPRWYGDELGHGPLVDLYMLGAVGFYVLTGQHKPLAPSFLTKPNFRLPELFSEVPGIDGVYNMLRACVVDDPADMGPTSADDLARVLRAHRTRLENESSPRRADEEPRHLFSYSNEATNSGDVVGLSEIPVWIPPGFNDLMFWLRADTHPFVAKIWNPIAPIDKITSSVLNHNASTLVPVPEKLRGRWVLLSLARAGGPGNGVVRSLAIFATKGDQ